MFFFPLKSLNLTVLPETSTRLKSGAFSPTFGDSSGDCAVDAQPTKKANTTKIKPIFFILSFLLFIEKMSRTPQTSFQLT
jgi:hypothetical protein